MLPSEIAHEIVRAYCSIDLVPIFREVLKQMDPDDRNTVLELDGLDSDQMFYYMGLMDNDEREVFKGGIVEEHVSGQNSLVNWCAKERLDATDLLLAAFELLTNDGKVRGARVDMDEYQAVEKSNPAKLLRKLIEVSLEIAEDQGDSYELRNELGEVAKEFHDKFPTLQPYTPVNGATGLARVEAIRSNLRGALEATR